MTSDPVALGSRRQYERPDWRPLERFLASDELCNQFMWMCDLALDDGAILNAYKHHDTRRYLYLTDDGRTFDYLGDDHYRCVDPYSALAAAFQNWECCQPTASERHELQATLERLSGDQPETIVPPIDVHTWITTYHKAWEQADEELVVSLFTRDATYRTGPFREPYRGHDEIRAYWRRAVGSQREIRVRMGTPIVEGNRVAVEWWTTALDDDQPATICGCLLLHFGSDGRCRDLREYWNREDDRSAPFPGWGT